MIPYTREYAMSEFAQHGELQMMTKLSKYDFRTIFDVGANIGEWSRMVRPLHRNAVIHQFEVVPDTYYKLLNNGVLDAGMVPNNFGLSDQTGTRTIKYVPDNDRVSTFIHELNHDNSIERTVLTVTGWEYCMIHDIREIDFLKIDTEGHDYDVIFGFGLKPTDARVIQFEYGYTSVLTKRLLVDFYRLLQDHYVIGRLTPEGVHFKDFHLFDEDFKGPDYVAVRRDQVAIIEDIRAK